MFLDLLKHQSMSRIDTVFLKYLSAKYQNKVNISQYMIERLISHKIRTVFSDCRYHSSPFINACSQHTTNYNNFDVVFTPFTKSYTAKAIIYSQENKSPGVVINNSHHNVTGKQIGRHLTTAFHQKIPLVLLSFYNNNPGLNKIEQSFETYTPLMKESYTAKRVDTFANLFEYMLMLSTLPTKGLVHLKISNDILDQTMDLKSLSGTESSSLKAKLNTSLDSSRL